MKTQYKYCLFLIILVLITTSLPAQINILSRIKKLPYHHYYQEIADCEVHHKEIKRKTQDHWIAFSDSEENITFSDPFGRKELSSLGFMDPLLVLKTRNGYCKVISYDPEVINSGGIGELIGKGGKGFRLKDRKKVQYHGWIKEERLLNSPRAMVCGYNLNPAKFHAGISHPKMVLNREAYIENDSFLLAQAPGFRKEIKHKAPLHDWVYIYKKIENPPQYLIGTVPEIDQDSIQGIFGWVSDSALLPLAQNSLLLPKTHSPNDSISPSLEEPGMDFPARWTNEKHAESGSDTSLMDLGELAFFKDENWFLPADLPIRSRLLNTEEEVRTFVPMELVDMRRSKTYNCVGQPLTFQEYEALQTQLKTINMLVVFEDGKEGKEVLRNMISSLQDLYQLTHKHSMNDISFNYAAVGYMGRWVSDTLNWTNSFSRWLDFIQRRAEDTSIEFLTYEHVMLRGLQEAARFLKDHEREHNIIIVIGSKINANTFPKLFDHVVPQLSEVAANLVFLQSNRGKAAAYSDMVLQAKRILNEVGKGAAEVRQEIIVDNTLVKYKNELSPIDRCGNGYLFDFPEQSMQKGGLFFPKANAMMCPDLLEWAIDTIFNQIKQDNETLLSGIAENFRMLGRLQQEVNPRLTKILDDQGVLGMPDSVANIYNDPFYVEVSAEVDHPSLDERRYDTGFLIHQREFDELIHQLRKVVIDPKINRNGDSEVDYKDRKRWSRELKRTYKEQNKFYQRRGRAKHITLAEVIFMKTGFPVNNAFFHDKTLRNVRKKNGVEQEELLPQIEYFYRDIFELEGYPSENPDAVIDRGSNQYFIIPAERLP